MDTLWLSISILVATGGVSGASFIFGYNNGFRKGGRRVVEEWKKTLEITEENNNDES